MSNQNVASLTNSSIPDSSIPNTDVVSVLDYGSGNLGSVLRALAAIGRTYKIVRSPEEVHESHALIFPGVGSAEQAMGNLKSSGNDKAIVEFASTGKPLLGICVGMQVLCVKSEEGSVRGLGIFPFELVQFQITNPVPHMGWNELVWNTAHSEIGCFARMEQASEANCYFVHSYYAKPSHEGSLLTTPQSKHSNTMDFVLAETEYSGVTFPSFIAHKNIWGMQFHVEKSGAIGLALLSAFCQKVDTPC
jgi:imidazole glycerol-phosphate synthase subunit HisH